MSDNNDDINNKIAKLQEQLDALKAQAKIEPTKVIDANPENSITKLKRVNCTEGYREHARTRLKDRLKPLNPKGTKDTSKVCLKDSALDTLAAMFISGKKSKSGYIKIADVKKERPAGTTRGAISHMLSNWAEVREALDNQPIVYRHPSKYGLYAPTREFLNLYEKVVLTFDK